MDKETKDKFLRDLMEDTYEKLYTFISRKQPDKGLVEDIVQETFLEAYRKAELLMEHPNQMGWLYLTAKNKRMKMSAKKKEMYFWDEEEIDYVEDPDMGEAEYSEIELAETLKASVSEKEYEMFCDYFLNGYSSTEVADKYGIDKNVIRMRMSRMKKKLRKTISAGWLIFVVCICRLP